ncbi:High affinity nitrate transporter 2.6-like [Heracleum sosnowskyi]|uniref:High affinity nitrate transporter 2.6-like n=1 Tax=Heracleum sosnowskyi TaxID=360622 RepID=A0AAD8J6B6_9APIA|nr:High affinity nitrate transporter 2.6-like [Heracleum sosnowskyi]
MELLLRTSPFATITTTRINKLEAGNHSFHRGYDFSRKGGLMRNVISAGLVETASSIAVAATVVGAAATLLVRRTKASEATEVPYKTCEDCSGSGICSECRGEGFVLKRLSDGNAEKARLNAKNAATRYTAGLPKKWSYCSKCSSARSCSSCGGSGKLEY